MLRKALHNRKVLFAILLACTLTLSALAGVHLSGEPKHEHIHGYGACTREGCNCQGYVSSPDDKYGNRFWCANCGHPFGSHR